MAGSGPSVDRRIPVLGIGVGKMPAAAEMSMAGMAVRGLHVREFGREAFHRTLDLGEMDGENGGISVLRAGMAGLTSVSAFVGGTAVAAAVEAG